MARILIAITGLTGIRNASLELAGRLQRAGHDLTLTAPRELGETVAAAGVAFFSLPAIDEQPEKRSADREEAVAITYPETFVAHLEKEDYDLLICDVELHEYIITAYGRGVTILLLSQWYSLWDRPGLPYLLHDTIPGVGFAGSRLGMWLSWQRIKLGRRRMNRKRELRTEGKNRRSALLALAEQEGFPADFIRKSFWPGPFTYTGLPVIAMAPCEMEFPHRKLPTLHYAGPMVSAQRPERSLPELQAVYDEQEKTGASLLLCTMTTMQGRKDDFLERLIEAVAAREDWLLVVGAGKNNPTSHLRPRPKNVYLFDYVPQLEILRRADLSINHGGIHTIHECLHFGVPMLVYSGKKSDQNGCAARVHYHGVGLMADRDEDQVTDIRQKIDHVLTTEKYRTSVDQMQAHCTRYATAEVAEKIVSKALNQEL